MTPGWRGVGEWPRVVFAMAFLTCGLGALGDLSAQDIEAVARMRGLELPQSYYDLVQRDPTAFTLPNGLFRVDGQGRAQVAGVQGTKRVAILPSLFADSPEPHVSTEDLQRAVFDGPSARGTLTDAYLEMSRGLLRVTGEVSPWVRVSLPVGQRSGAGPWP